MLIIREEKKFRKDIKLMLKRSKDLEKLKGAVSKLVNQEHLPSKNRDHALSGDYQGFKECHIEPDWLLIYRITKEELVLVRTGTHSDLF